MGKNDVDYWGIAYNGSAAGAPLFYDKTERENIQLNDVNGYDSMHHNFITVNDSALQNHNGSETGQTMIGFGWMLPRVWYQSVSWERLEFMAPTFQNTLKRSQNAGKW